MDKSTRYNLLAATAIVALAITGVTLHMKSNTTASTYVLPPKTLAENKTLTGSIKTNQGTIELSLDGTKAPQGVSVFKYLSDKDFFKNTSCHRLTTSGIYVLQCGDPQGNGSGGPGFTWGPVENAPANNIYSKGTVAVARVGGEASSQGSQFFLVYKDSEIPADSAGGYTIVGKVTHGLDVVEKVAAAGVKNKASDGAPVEAVKIESFNIN